MILKIPFRATFYILLYIVFSAASIEGFSEEAIFEDEDIYNHAQPPKNTTSYTSVVPGTKWCGPGNKASNYNDLGSFRDTDICCRDHDYCDEIIEPNAMLYGISNAGMFPILKCTCEQKFINCLQAINSVFSNTLGRIYFANKKSCLGLGHPTVSCSQFQQGTFRKRCIRYTIDKKKTTIWQLYDMPFYSMYNSTEHK